MRCAVLNCGNDNHKKACEISFFQFPADVDVRKKWVKFCRRKDKFNVKTSHICMWHFKDEDFENSLKYEMGFTKKRFLKRGVVPSVRSRDLKNPELRERRLSSIQKRENKKIVDALLRDHDSLMAANKAEIAFLDLDKVDVIGENFHGVDQDTGDLFDSPNLKISTDYISCKKIEQINEDGFNINCTTESDGVSKRHLKTIGTQTKFDESYACGFVTVTRDFMDNHVNCFYCDVCFSICEWDEFMRHIGSEHCWKLISCFETADLVETPAETIDGGEEAAIELQVLQGADDNETASSFKFKEHNFENELLVSNETEDIEELFKTQSKLDNVNTAQSEKKSDNQINIETSDDSLVFYIIDLLQSCPSLWFIDGVRTKQYKKAFSNVYTQFSEKYTSAMTKKELHESLIKIRDWYQTNFEQKNFGKLSYPQSEYYRKLAVFMPDKSNGKTCEFCGRLFEDHVQYFAHKKLDHKEIAHENEKLEETSLVGLKQHVIDYFSARYPRYQPGNSYKCQICLKHFERRNRLFEHIRTHLDIRNHVCHICGKSFIKKQNFAAHKKTHFDVHKWKCLICGFSFKTCTELTVHRKRYHRPIEGAIEEMALPQRRKFSERFIPFIDGNIERYACPFCEKTFAYKTGALRHYNLSHKTKKESESRKVKENFYEIEVD